MVYLKLKDWRNAENDATTALSFDPNHIKSYHRRASARYSLGKLRAALYDIQWAKQVTQNSKLSDSSFTETSKDTNGKKKECISSGNLALEHKIKKALLDAIQKAPKRQIHVVVTNGTQNDCKETLKKNDDAHDNSTNIIMSHKPSQCSTKPVSSFHGHDKQNHNDISQDSHQPLALSSTTKIKTVPKTWHEFKSIWNSYKTKSDRIHILSLTQPSRITKLFKHGIEDTNLLVDILMVASEMEDATKYVKALSRIQKLHITTMMMTEDERSMVKEAICKSFSKCGDKSHSNVAWIAQQFGCDDI